MPSPAKPTIYDRVAAHSAAVARHEASCDPADRNSEIGRSLTPAELSAAAAENVAAVEMEEATLNALLAHVPCNLVEMRRQIGYLRFFLDCRDTLDRDQLELLFQALMQFHPHQHDA